MSKLAIIGGGNLGTSIAAGLLKNHVVIPKDLIITRNRLKFLKEFEEKGVTITSDNKLAVSSANIILIAVKPFRVLDILKEIKTAIDPTKQIVISVASGITIDQMLSVLDQNTPIARVMPNTAAAVEESISCFCTKNCTEDQKNNVTTLFDGVGETIEIPEDLMRAATVLGACGIAYALRFVRAMIQGGIEIGFDANTATKIATQTVKGAAQLLIANKKHPEEEIDKVTTPKGNTIAGLNEMEHQGFSSALIRGIIASHERI